MKRFLIICFISIFISFISGELIFNVYRKNLDDTISVINEKEKVYMLLYGSYNNIDKVNKLELDDYIMIKDNNFYEVYVGISKNIENCEKIRGIYKEMGNNIYIREKEISNMEFIDYLNYMENNLNDKSNEEIINIEKNIIDKYKEIYE